MVTWLPPRECVSEERGPNARRGRLIQSSNSVRKPDAANRLLPAPGFLPELNESLEVLVHFDEGVHHHLVEEDESVVVGFRVLEFAVDLRLELAQLGVSIEEAITLLEGLGLRGGLDDC